MLTPHERPLFPRTGTIMDVEHVVILMQENRSFDHYFGTLRGVRGFGDRFPIPLANSPDGGKRNVWRQWDASDAANQREVLPFHLDSIASFSNIRIEGTPHLWPDAQRAWNHGKLDFWPSHKRAHSMGYFARDDLPYQFALADAFTICDAYHCAFQGGTNPNRVFAWTGTNDPAAASGGPVIDNSYDHLEHDPDGGYLWTTYPERLQAAGVSWQVYQDMADNYTDNPLAGFRTFRDAWHAAAGADRALLDWGLSTRTVDHLKRDALSGHLPQVSFIVATADGSEHPVASSPAQGAEFTARVIDALTANPETWKRTVLFLMYDENDGYFDHVPPPAAPSCLQWHAEASQAVFAGASTISTVGEYHAHHVGDPRDPDAMLHRPYGPGPRVPMLVISPWSRGGWVNSQVFDHSSVIRFLERRFGVMEPNISPWRRAVCGDLTSAFDFTRPDDSPFLHLLPETAMRAQRARQLRATVLPLPNASTLPVQSGGTRPSRALSYELHVDDRFPQAALELCFSNTGAQSAVFHVYDRHRLDDVPQRFAVEPGKRLSAAWPPKHDVWIAGPNGFHRHYVGDGGVLASGLYLPQVQVRYDAGVGGIVATLSNAGQLDASFAIVPNAYATAGLPMTLIVKPREFVVREFSAAASGGWYDFSVFVQELPGYLRRFAGRVETGRDSISDPAMGGIAAL